MKWQHVRHEPAIWSYLEFTRNLVWKGGGCLPSKNSSKLLYGQTNHFTI
jgi:hypothetical protein